MKEAFKAIPAISFQLSPPLSLVSRCLSLTLPLCHLCFSRSPSFSRCFASSASDTAQHQQTFQTHIATIVSNFSRSVSLPPNFPYHQRKAPFNVLRAYPLFFGVCFLLSFESFQCMPSLTRLHLPLLHQPRPHWSTLTNLRTPHCLHHNKTFPHSISLPPNSRAIKGPFFNVQIYFLLGLSLRCMSPSSLFSVFFFLPYPLSCDRSPSSVISSSFAT